MTMKGFKRKYLPGISHQFPGEEESNSLNYLYVCSVYLSVDQSPVPGLGPGQSLLLPRILIFLSPVSYKF